MRKAIKIGVVGAVILTAVYCLFGPPEITTWVWRYPHILKHWKTSGLADHFPAQLPASATNVRFSSFPGFLQGGAWIQVRMTVPAVEAKAVFDTSTELARYTQDGGSSYTILESSKVSLLSTRFYTSGSRNREFPEDYRIFVYDAQPSRKGENPSWNHGMSRGVVVSLQRNEVIYYADRW
jgi:hypothetical protein